MEKIEELEQLLLQHMRTAGLRNNKENMLIEEMLDLRKERRKMITSLVEKNNAVQQENNELREQSRQLTDKSQALINLLKEQHKTELQRRDEEFKTLESALRTEIQLLHDNSKLNEEKTVEVVKNSYEAKFFKLETKLKQLLKEKEINDLSKAKMIAENLLKKVTSEIEEKYKKRLAECKEAVKNIADREHDLLESNKRYKDLTDTMKTENK
jgi:hypothetical protein